MQPTSPIQCITGCKIGLKCHMTEMGLSISLMLLHSWVFVGFVVLQTFSVSWGTLCFKHQLVILLTKPVNVQIYKPWCSPSLLALLSLLKLACASPWHPAGLQRLSCFLLLTGEHLVWDCMRPVLWLLFRHHRSLPGSITVSYTWPPSSQVSFSPHRSDLSLA